MNNKLWLITGISSGLGKALAESVIKNGDFVIGTFRHKSQVEEYNSKNIKNTKAILLDITDEKNIEKSIEKIIVIRRSEKCFRTQLFWNT